MDDGLEVIVDELGDNIFKVKIQLTSKRLKLLSIAYAIIVYLFYLFIRLGEPRFPRSFLTRFAVVYYIFLVTYTYISNRDYMTINTQTKTISNSKNKCISYGNSIYLIRSYNQPNWIQRTLGHHFYTAFGEYKEINEITDGQNEVKFLYKHKHREISNKPRKRCNIYIQVRREIDKITGHRFKVINYPQDYEK